MLSSLIPKILLTFSSFVKMHLFKSLRQPYAHHFREVLTNVLYKIPNTYIPVSTLLYAKILYSVLNTAIILRITMFPYSIKCTLRIYKLYV